MSKRQTKNIIQIKGFRGLLMAAFIAICLAAGFVAFPGWLAMLGWNYAATSELATDFIPQISLYQGVLLWAVVAITCYILNKRGRQIVVYRDIGGLSDDEIQQVLDNIKMQSAVSEKENK